MKKILSLGVAAAVVAMTAVAASATLKADIVEENVVAGQTITVKVNTDAEIGDVQFNLVTSDNLEYVSHKADGIGAFNKDNGKYGWAGSADAGDALLEVTYKVVDGDKVSIALEPGNDAYAGVISIEPIEQAVVGGSTTTPGTTTPGTTEPGTTTPGTENPGTGVALAVVPAVLAGAAIVVSKKRK